MINKGDQFPSFNLPDETGTLRNNTHYMGAPYIIYFYPKDDTSGCTTEACEFTAIAPDFGDLPIVGVSPDSVKSHAKFIKKHNLGITLLADEDKVLIGACGLWVEKSMYGKKYMGVDRTTYLVDKDGVVLEIWTKVKPSGHAAEVLKAVHS